MKLLFIITSLLVDYDVWLPLSGWYMFLMISSLNFKQEIFFIVLFYIFLCICFGGLIVGNLTALNLWLSSHDLLRLQNIGTHSQKLVLILALKVLFLLLFLSLLLSFSSIWTISIFPGWRHALLCTHIIELFLTYYPVTGLGC